ncbi:MAG: FkbM family methyltransferase [Planctomycetes bacterium]|nr:FkbM family methyltransferase [Planctomycetota bacterium]
MPSLASRIRFLRKRGLRYAWILFARKLWLRRTSVTFNGRRYLVPTDDMSLELVRDDEPWMIPLLKRLLPRTPGVFVDVGVNIGQTLARVKAVEPARACVCFEPNPDCCKVLRGLMQLNDYGEVRLIEAALSDAAGSVSLHVDESADVRGSIIEGFRDNMKPGQRTIEVPMVDGRQLLNAELGAAVGFIKIDVEGAELEVLRGLRPVIERDHPIILFELLGTGSADPAIESLRESRQAELLELFPELRYALRRLRPDLKLEMFGEPEKYPDQSMCNYLAIPDDRLDEISALL